MIWPEVTDVAAPTHALPGAHGVLDTHDKSLYSQAVWANVALLRPMRALIRRSLLTPAEGAKGATRIATDPAMGGVPGRYFNRDRESSTPPVSHDHTTSRNRSR